MGYAKYKEDIEKIYSQNVFGTFLDFQVGVRVPHFPRPICHFEAHSKQERETHVLAEHRDAEMWLP